MLNVLMQTKVTPVQQDGRPKVLVYVKVKPVLMTINVDAVTKTKV